MTSVRRKRSQQQIVMSVRRFLPIAGILSVVLLLPACPRTTVPSPSLLEPMDNAVLNQSRVLFNWDNTLFGVSEYYFILDREIQDILIPRDQVTYSLAARAEPYEWFIIARDGNRASESIERRTFVVGSDTCGFGVSPVDGQEVCSTPTILIDNSCIPLSFSEAAVTYSVEIINMDTGISVDFANGFENQYSVWNPLPAGTYHYIVHVMWPAQMGGTTTLRDDPSQWFTVTGTGGSTAHFNSPPDNTSICIEQPLLLDIGTELGALQAGDMVDYLLTWEWGAEVASGTLVAPDLTLDFSGFGSIGWHTLQIRVGGGCTTIWQDAISLELRDMAMAPSNLNDNAPVCAGNSLNMTWSFASALTYEVEVQCGGSGFSSTGVLTASGSASWTPAAPGSCEWRIRSNDNGCTSNWILQSFVVNPAC